MLVAHVRPAVLLTLLAGLPALASAPATLAADAAIPLPEHPRPDFARAEWQNLNGPWSFRFDKDEVGEREGWPSASLDAFPVTISVPFPWGSPLSGVKDEAEVAWYARSIRIPESWTGKRVFLVVGASDWETTAWLDGQPLGRHRGGYDPFEFELTPTLVAGREARLVVRVDDKARAFKLEGKQGYGNARGIWQTAYLEARPQVALDTVQFTPDLAQRQVKVRALLSTPAPKGTTLGLEFRTGGRLPVTRTVPAGSREVAFAVPMPDARLWSLDDPFLYETDVVLTVGGVTDRVATYFGMRSVGVTRLPESGIPYVALNGRPVYLQMALDQSYHPEGFYTFPSDAFMRDEILRSRRIGLNALRIHIKLEIPRKLYWADRLGLLIMEDVPNSWGVPDIDMRAESEAALRAMIRRDFNHPSIFSWVLFNETWGLQQKDEKKTYLPETQDWVASVWRLTKQLDPTRLVEDQSPCNNDHVVTDLNTWHVYLPGYGWREHLDQVVRDTFPGSPWNFIGGRTQAEQPLFNSEAGNVWGYEGSTGDVDWSYDYHVMMNELRKRPKIGGWLYTEHHDVINEWNGYYRYDRSEKETGLGEIVPGMSLLDLHGPFYLSPGVELVTDARPGERVRIPLTASFMTDGAPTANLVVRAKVTGTDDLGGRFTSGSDVTASVTFSPWSTREVSPLDVPLPARRGLAVVALTLEDGTGAVLHRNFVAYRLTDGPTPREESSTVEGRKLRLLRISPGTHSRSEWSGGSTGVLDGLKVNGFGSGFFEYRLPWPGGLRPEDVVGATFRAELSSRPLLGRDRAASGPASDDYMRGAGHHDPSANPNAYPMTDGTKNPTAIRITVADRVAGVIDIADDPADHRGLLSWQAQPRDRRLREAGTFGDLVTVTIPRDALAAAAGVGEIVVRLSVDPAFPGGLAIYGEKFGRYPLDPTIALELR